MKTLILAFISVAMATNTCYKNGHEVPLGARLGGCNCTNSPDGPKWICYQLGATTMYCFSGRNGYNQNYTWTEQDPITKTLQDCKCAFKYMAFIDCKEAVTRATNTCYKNGHEVPLGAELGACNCTNSPDGPKWRCYGLGALTMFCFSGRKGYNLYYAWTEQDPISKKLQNCKCAFKYRGYIECKDAVPRDTNICYEDDKEVSLGTKLESCNCTSSPDGPKWGCNWHGATPSLCVRGNEAFKLSYTWPEVDAVSKKLQSCVCGFRHITVINCQPIPEDKSFCYYNNKKIAVNGYEEGCTCTAFTDGANWKCSRGATSYMCLRGREMFTVGFRYEAKNPTTQKIEECSCPLMGYPHSIKCGKEQLYFPGVEFKCNDDMGKCVDAFPHGDRKSFTDEEMCKYENSFLSCAEPAIEKCPLESQKRFFLFRADSERVLKKHYDCGVILDATASFAAKKEATLTFVAVVLASLFYYG